VILLPDDVGCLAGGLCGPGSAGRFAGVIAVLSLQMGTCAFCASSLAQRLHVIGAKLAATAARNPGSEENLKLENPWVFPCVEEGASSAVASRTAQHDGAPP
jgi:hypothetical protein